jgi:hypothetical protein
MLTIERNAICPSYSRGQFFPCPTLPPRIPLRSKSDTSTNHSQSLLNADISPFPALIFHRDVFDYWDPSDRSIGTASLATLETP